MFRLPIYLLALGALATLALGYMGQLHPLGDSLAVFRLPNLVIALILILALGRSKIRTPSVIGIIVCLLVLAANYVPHNIDSSDHYHIYQKNLLFKIVDTDPLKADILASGNIDFATFQEVTDQNSTLLAELKSDFPYQTRCAFAHVGGVAIASRWPIIAGSTQCRPKSGMVAIQVQTPSGPLWIVSLHLHWPYPYGQAAQVKRLLPHIEALSGPKVIAGDFNMVPWSHIVGTITDASNTKIAGPARHSLSLPYIFLNIPIDHVLVPRGSLVNLTRRGTLGSDHHGVVAAFQLP